MNSIEKAREFLEFQEKQYGILPASDAAEWAKCSRQTLGKWAKRGIVKVFPHRGTLYIGLDSLRTAIQARVMFFGPSMKGRMRYPKPKPLKFKDTVKTRF